MAGISGHVPAVENVALDLPGSAVRVEVASEQDRSRWDQFVASHPETRGYHEWSWRAVFERAFGHRCVYLMATGQDGVEGVLPLVEIRSRVFGNSLTSLPFVNYGGVLSRSIGASRALLEAGRERARADGCRYVELRHVGRQFSELPCKQHKVAMLLPLRPGLWDRLDRKVRNQIRKAQKSDLSVAHGGVELLDAFYTVFSRNMRDLGTPVYSRRLFDETVRTFPDRTRVTVVRLQGKPIAAGLTYRTGRTMQIPWASSVREYNHLCPNALLYWSVLEAAIDEGCDLFDFGRSTLNEGTYKFKEQWGAQPTALHWEYCLLPGSVVPDLNPGNPRFKAAIELWKRCPLWLANAAGPWIVRSLP